MQVWGLFRQDRHDLVPVAVGGGPTDPEAGREHGHLLVLAKPHQPQQGLSPAAQRPATSASTAAFPLRAQQTAQYYIHRSSFPLSARLVDQVWAMTSPTITWWAGTRIFVC